MVGGSVVSSATMREGTKRRSASGDFHRREVNEAKEVDDRNLPAQRPVAFLDEGAARRCRQVKIEILH